MGLELTARPCFIRRCVERCRAQVGDGMVVVVAAVVVAEADDGEREEREKEKGTEGGTKKG